MNVSLCVRLEGGIVVTKPFSECQHWKDEEQSLFPSLITGTRAHCIRKGATVRGSPSVTYCMHA